MIAQQTKQRGTNERPGTQLLRELVSINECGELNDGTQTFILCRNETYLSGIPFLFSNFAERAFIFKNAAQAESLIKKYPVLLAGARVGHFNRKLEAGKSE